MRLLPDLCCNWDQYQNICSTETGSNASSLPADTTGGEASGSSTTAPASAGGSPGSGNTATPLPYSSSPTNTPHRSRSLLGPILGSVLGALGAITIIAVVVIYYRHRTRKTISPDVQPFANTPTAEFSPTSVKLAYADAPPSPYTPSSPTTGTPGTQTHHIASQLGIQALEDAASRRQSTFTAGRDEQLRNEVERLRSEMVAVNSGRPPPVLPDYENAVEDVLIFRA